MVFVLFPLMWTISYFEIKLIYEVCPLKTHINFYIVYIIFVWIFTLALIGYIIDFVKSWCFIDVKFDDFTYYFITLLPAFLSIICSYLPAGVEENFRYLNFRVFYVFPAANLILPIICNAIFKRKEDILNFSFILLIITDLIIFLIFRYPLEFVAKSQTELMFIQVLALLIIFYSISFLQAKYGSRFFLPNRWRNKVYEFRRSIAEEFDLTKLEENMWPEWNYWMQKLHLPSLLSNDKSLKILNGLESNLIYMKTQDNRLYHYFCLEHIIWQGQLSNYPYKSIDYYDD